MSAIYLKAKHFRLLDKKGFQIENVFPAYRSGWIMRGDKFEGKSFYFFDVEWSDKKELKEKTWNKEERVWEFKKYEGKLDKEFFSTYKKVYDIEVTLLDSINAPLWNKDEKKEEDTFIAIGEKVVFQGIDAYKLKTMMEDLELDEDVELVEGKDEDGKPKKVKPFDWEDGVIPLVVGQKVEMRVRGEGKNSKYSFKPSTKKVEKNDELTPDDIPF